MCPVCCFVHCVVVRWRPKHVGAIIEITYDVSVFCWFYLTLRVVRTQNDVNHLNIRQPSNTENLHSVCFCCCHFAA
jgi:hypothetical protein